MAENSVVQVEPHTPSQRGGPHIQVSGGASAMSHYVRLDALPDGLEFPADLKKRISYDAAKRRLIFHGFMSKGDFDRLASLHHDLAYARAIEALFQISTEADAPQFRPISLVLAILVVLCLILAVVVWWQLLREPVRSGDTRPEVRRSVAASGPQTNCADVGRST